MSQSPKRSTALYAALLALGVLPLLVNGWVNARIAARPAAYWAFELFTWLLIPLLVFTVAIRHGGLRPGHVGLGLRIAGRRSAAGLIAACAVACPLAYWSYGTAFALASALFPAQPFFQYESVVPTGTAARVVVVAWLGLSAGIVEELYFRGLMHRLAAATRHPAACYLTLSPILFASIHWEGGLANVIATYLFGLLAAAAFLALRNLLPLIAGHVFTNVVWFA